MALRELTNSAIALSPKELLNIPGVERSRADVLIPGLLILEGLTTKLPVVEIVVSHFSLRHGVLDEARKDPKIERHPGNGAREEKYQ